MKFTKEKFLKIISESYSQINEQDEPEDEYVNFDDDDEADDDEADDESEYTKGDSSTVRVAKLGKNVKQRGLYRSVNPPTQFGVMVKKVGDQNQWVQAYYLDSCKDADSYQEFFEKYDTEVQNLKRRFDTNGVTVVLIVNAECPNVGNNLLKPKVPAKTRRSYENLKAKALNKYGATVYDYETGNIISNDEFGATIKQFPRGVPAFLVYLKDQLIKTFAFDGTTDKKQREVQRDLAEKYVAFLVKEGIGTIDDIKIVEGKNQHTVQKKIKDVFMKVIREQLSEKTQEGKEFIDMLNQRSIPGILPDDKRFLDRYTPVWTNDKVKYRLVSYNIYKTSDEFLQAVFDRSLGEETPEMHTTNTSIHVRATNAPIRTRDEKTPTKKAAETAKSGQPGYEPKSYERIGNYNVQVLDLYDNNHNVMVKTEFVIEGELIDNTYVWSAKITNSFGRKKPDEFKVKELNPLKLSDNSFLNDGSTIVVTQNVQLSPNESFTDKRTIMSNDGIAVGLKMVLVKLKNEIASIDPMTLLDTAVYDRSDVERIDESINNLIKQSIMEFYRSK